MTETSEAISPAGYDGAQPDNDVLGENTPVFDSGGDSIDSLLSEFDAATKSPPQIPVEAQDALQSEWNYLNEAQRAYHQDVENYQLQRAQEHLDASIKATIGEIRGDLNPECFDDGLVGAWLDNQARTNPAALEAFLGQHENPRAWEVVKERLKRDFHKKYSRLPDPQATEDHNAVAAAVRGASGPPPQESDHEYRKRVSRMTNAEFEQHARELLGS